MAKYPTLTGRERELERVPRRRLGYIPEPGVEPSLFEREVLAQQHYEGQETSGARVAPPRAVDLRNLNGKNYVTPVKDQQSCGSCVAFGCVATAEGTILSSQGGVGPAPNLSEAHLFFCHGRRKGRHCGNGWWPGGALTEFKTAGVVDENCFPYPRIRRGAPTPACRPCSDANNRLRRIAAWGTLDKPLKMKEHLAAAKGPLIACYSVYTDFQSFFRQNPRGVYRRTSNTVSGGHCVSVVGYDDTSTGTGFWICKNSWGPGFADRGFFRIGYGQCGIDAYMWYVRV